ncbi:hypothetical protein PAMA_012237 [Pampus argenteus]
MRYCPESDTSGLIMGIFSDIYQNAEIEMLLLFKEGEEEEEEVDPGGYGTGHAGDESRQAGRLSCRQAAKRFGVPKFSLSQLKGGLWLSPRSEATSHPAEDEKSLVEDCLYSASHGFPLMMPPVLRLNMHTSRPRGTRDHITVLTEC